MNQGPVAPVFSLGVVILAAGASRRMGKPKLLLPWGKTSVLGHLVEQWRALRAEQIAVVMAADDRAMMLELDRVGFSVGDRISNRDPSRGMFSSIQCAAQWQGWRPSLSHWAIALGDQPHLQRQTLQQVLDFAAAHPARVCQPARHGRGRHPVLLPGSVFRRLAGSTALTLKDFLASTGEAAALCELPDAGLDLDVDRPEDYAQALRSHFP
jgi:molybdenum cofactor cytidylyltransferase